MQGLRGTPSRQLPRTGVSWPYVLASCLHSHQNRKPPKMGSRAKASKESTGPFVSLCHVCVTGCNSESKLRRAVSLHQA